MKPPINGNNTKSEQIPGTKLRQRSGNVAGEQGRNRSHLLALHSHGHKHNAKHEALTGVYPLTGVKHSGASVIYPAAVRRCNPIAAFQLAVTTHLNGLNLVNSLGGSRDHHEHYSAPSAPWRTLWNPTLRSALTLPKCVNRLRIPQLGRPLRTNLSFEMLP